MNKKNKGILFIICSAFCFALMGMFVKLAGDLPSIEKSFFRNLVALLFALIILKKDHVHFSGKKENIKYLVIRSVAGTVGILCNFYAVDHLVLSDASMLNKMSPFFAILFSILILKENFAAAGRYCHRRVYRKSFDLEAVGGVAGIFSGVDRSDRRYGSRICVYQCACAWRKRRKGTFCGSIFLRIFVSCDVALSDL